MNRGTRNHTSARAGFTLVELLIVITIMLLLMSITVYTVRDARDTDRVSSAASRVQSFLNGARDRAIFEKRPIGVRLFTDAEDLPGAPSALRRTVASMTYIDPIQIWSQGTISLQRADTNGDGAADADLVNRLEGSGAAWWELKRRGLLVDGLVIEIGEFRSPVNTSLIDVESPKTGGPELLILDIPYLAKGTTPARNITAFSDGGPSTYRLYLPPKILPVAPAILPDRTVIDLDASQLPLAWRAGASGLGFSQYMDLVFSPRGTLIGSAASQGVIHLYVADKEDATVLKEQRIQSMPGASLAAQVANFETTIPFVPADEVDPAITGAAWIGDLADPGEPYTPNDRRLVTIFAQTGSVTVSLVNSIDDSDGNTNDDRDGIVDSPYFLAEGVN